MHHDQVKERRLEYDKVITLPSELIGTLQIHDAANMLPDLSEDEIRALDESLEQNGFDPAYPIELFRELKEWKVLVGKHRLKRALAKGIDPWFMLRAPKHGTNPFDRVCQFELGRRHLARGARASYLQKLTEEAGKYAEKKEKERQAFERHKAKKKANDSHVDAPSRGNDASEKTKESGKSATLHFSPKSKPKKQALADASGASPRTAQDAINVAKRSPALRDKVANGKISLPAAVAATRVSPAAYAILEDTEHAKNKRTLKALAEYSEDRQLRIAKTLREGKAPTVQEADWIYRLRFPGHDGKEPVYKEIEAAYQEVLTQMSGDMNQSRLDEHWKVAERLEGYLPEGDRYKGHAQDMRLARLASFKEWERRGFQPKRPKPTETAPDSIEDRIEALFDTLDAPRQHSLVERLKDKMKLRVVK